MLIVEDYSDRAIAIFGSNLLAYEDKLLALGGKKNPNLRGLNENEKRLGFIFPIKKKPDVVQLVSEWNANPLAKPTEKAKPASYSKTTPEVTHDMLSKLLSTVEILQAEVAYLKKLVLNDKSCSSSKPQQQQDNELSYSEESEEEQEEKHEQPQRRLLRKK